MSRRGGPAGRAARRRGRAGQNACSGWCEGFAGCDPGHTFRMTTGQVTVPGRGLGNIRYLRYCLDIARPNVNLVEEAWIWLGRGWSGVGAATWRCATTPTT
ncbi:hypothetical protein L839_0887 [Mycobacterium avium MAV_120809_2495]|nr:hypothetical protein L839_0887 [Mycobacterium avium MAV_120809_2495]